MEFSFSPKRLVVAVAAALPLMASAADTPSTATARKGFAGYDHPNQYLVKPATTIADNMMPVMQHPAQDKETQQKLAELEKKTGKKPNVVVFLLDDVGWMDVGFNGGGVAVGNPTPDIDAVASQGLILTSAYSQPSSSPTRATILTGQYSIHHGILMPPMYGQPGGLQGLTTLPQLLHDQATSLRPSENGIWGKTKSRSRRTLALMISVALTRCLICTPNGATFTSIRKWP